MKALNQLDLKLLYAIAVVSEESGGPCIPTSANADRSRSLSEHGYLSSHFSTHPVGRVNGAYTLTGLGIDSYNACQCHPEMIAVADPLIEEPGSPMEMEGLTC